MVKFKKGLLVITLVSLIMLSIRPFSIYADAIDGEFNNDSVVGVQVEEYEELLSGVQGTRYRFNIILDGFYVGNFNIHVEYDSYNVSTSNWDHYNIDRTVYVCGYDTYFETWMRGNWLPPSSITWSASVNNSDQCIYVGRMESQQLLNLLTAIRNTINTNEPLQTSYLAQINQNIEKLTKIRQWHIPFESYLFVDTFLTKLDPIFIHTYNNYDWPVFDVSSSWYSIPDFFLNPSNQGATYIFLINKNIQYKSAFKQYFRLYNYQTQQDDINYTITSKFYGYIMGETWYLIRVNVAPVESNTFISFRYINSSNAYIIPIYKNYKENNNISTDFALMWGLSNQLIDDLHIIAQGTQSSNSSASSLESSTSSFSSTASDVYNVEDQVSSGFSSSMQNIPSSFNFQNNFGSSFVVSASWVRDQFNNMTTNNPFGSLITFSLILGVALLIIGRLLT